MENLERLGVVLPFFLVHDVGLLFAAPSQQYEIGPRADIPGLLRSRGVNNAQHVGELVASYKRTLTELADCEAARKAGPLRLSDDLVTAVLARLLGVVAARTTRKPAVRGRPPLDPGLFERIEPQLVTLYQAVDRSFEVAALEGSSKCGSSCSPWATRSTPTRCGCSASSAPMVALARWGKSTCSRPSSHQRRTTS